MLPLTATTDWLSAVFGLVTTVVALYLLWQGERERRKRREVEARAQASKVSVSKPELGGLTVPYDNEWEGAVLFRINNRSEDVVSRLNIHGFLHDDKLAGSVQFKRHIDRIDGGEQADVLEQVSLPGEWAAFLAAGGRPQVEVTVFFIDAAGKNFLRDPDHSLRMANFNRPFWNLNKPLGLLRLLRRFQKWLKAFVWKVLD